MDRRTALAVGASLLLPALASCRGSHARGGRTTLNGAGATLPYPLYSKWIAEYARVVPEVRVNYQPIGSGAGIRQLLAGTIDFGASESPIEEKQGIVNIPASVGAVGVAVNLPRLRAPLRLEPAALGAIFRGRVKRWNDPALATTNPDVELPDQDIKVIHRTDGSGTTEVFSRYLASVDPEFSRSVGVGKSLRWPTGLGAKGNEGVAGQVRNTGGSIGYMELAYARHNSLPVAAVKNRAGRFVQPTAAAATSAAESAELQDTLQASLVNRTGETTYPIVTFTYMLVRENPRDSVKGPALARFVWWITHEGQRFAEALDYAPLPSSVVKRVEARLVELRATGAMLPARG